jgi:uncharacterized membrane protein YphA (DoxX/SURF4 family)
MSRFQLFAIAVALVALRLTIGFHFFFEGTDKLKSGNFQASYFLGGARGPLVPWFQAMLDDPTGKQKLCVVEVERDGRPAMDVDPALTLAIWDDFVDRASSHYGFDSDRTRKQLEDSIEKLRGVAGDSPVVQSELSAQEAALKQLGRQRAEANQQLKHHQQLLRDWLNENRVELIAHFSTAERLNGFQRDGAAAARTAMEVESLRQQVDSIRTDRTGKINQWSAQVVAIWDSLEQQVNRLAVGPQRDAGRVALHRPFDQPQSKLKWINKIIPWFDTTVGVLLILGLLTTPAAIAAALFLASVVLTQPFWIPGTTPTYYQLVELAGLLVIAAAGSANTLGLDYLWSLFRRSKPRSAAGAPTSPAVPQTA